MARPVRIEYRDAVYHVCARGNAGDAIFRDDDDRERFLATMGEACFRYGLIVHAYCLMPNHYHALVQTPRGNLGRSVGWVQSTYSMRFNKRHRRSGHVFQGRYKAHLVEADTYAVRLMLYIHLNPVRPRDKRARIPPSRRQRLDGYRWSSHRAYAGIASKKETADWLCQAWLSRFGDTSRKARRQYKGRIDEAFGAVVFDPFSELRGGLVLGGEAVWEWVKSLLGRSADAHVERWRTRATEQERQERVEKLVAAEPDRRVQIWLRVRAAGEPVTAVARSYAYRDASGVTRVVQRLEAKAKRDKKLASKLKTLATAAHPSNVTG